MAGKNTGLLVRGPALLPSTFIYVLLGKSFALSKTVFLTGKNEVGQGQFRGPWDHRQTLPVSLRQELEGQRQWKDG